MEKDDKGEKERKKKTKTIYIDSGNTVFDMSQVKGGKKQEKKEEGSKLSFKEKFALIKGVLSVYLPAFITIILGFLLAAVVLYLWLN